MSLTNIREHNLSNLAFGKYLKAFIDDASDPGLSEAQKLIVRYFKEKTGGARLASRDDLDPNDIRQHLHNVCLFNLLYDANGDLADIIHHLVGTAVVEFYGEMTGRSVREYPNQVIAKTIFSIVGDVVRERKTMRYYADEPVKESRVVAVDNLYVPLSRDGGKIDQIFVLFAKQLRD